MASSYLSRTPGSTTDAQRKQFTISMWVKRCSLLTGSGHQELVSANATDQFGFRFQGDNKLDIFDYSVSGNNYPLRLTTNRQFRDTSAWYNIVLQVDTPNSTSSDRVKLWVNGVQETSFATANYPSQDYTTSWNRDGLHQIGSKAWGNSGNGSDFFDGFLSHVANVAGSVVAPTVFGGTDSTSGIWKFKSPSATWGTNGFHLKFENSAALGTDSSGNSNTFTVNGNLKQSISTPSNVYNTLNPNYQSTFHSTSRATLANGNTKWTATSNNQSQNGILCTQGVNKGKWYLEAKWAGSYDSALGVAKDNFGMMTAGTGGLQSAGWYGMNTNISNTGGSGMAWWSNNSATGDRGNTISTNDIIMMAIDIDNNKLYFGKNGTWEESGDPTSGASGTGATSTLASDTTYIVACGNYGYSNANSWEFNFGEGRFGTTAISSAGSNGNGSLFEYDVPSGYYALNTKNINTYG